MSGPFIFVGTHRVKEGKLEEFRATAIDLAEVVEEREPQLHGFNFFLNEDETEATVVQVHPDAGSMLVHMQVGLSTSRRALRNCSRRGRSRSSVNPTTLC